MYKQSDESSDPYNEIGYSMDYHQQPKFRNNTGLNKDKQQRGTGYWSKSTDLTCIIFNFNFSSCVEFGV